MGLTGKKKAFADAVLAGKTNKDAAIAAGYSPATASAAGSRLVKDKLVSEYLRIHKATVENSDADQTTVEKGESAAQDGPKFDLAAAMQHTDPKVFLMSAMNDIALDPRQRIIAARALMPFVHGKVADQGKKDGRQDAAISAGKGKFSASPPPKLVVNNK